MKPLTSSGFKHFWHYAYNRQQIYLKKQANHLPPYTDNPILAKHRFTNPYRYTDRVSQYLINEVIDDNCYNWPDTFARIMLFKFFNSIPTWRVIAESFKTVDCQTIADVKLKQVLEHLASEKPLYNPAYVLPPPRQFQGAKFCRHLQLINLMLQDGLPLKLQQARTLRDAFSLLKSYDSIGDFLAYQFITDLNYSSHIHYPDERQFVVAGVGAKRGLKKCFKNYAQFQDEYLIEWTYNRQNGEFKKYNLAWQPLHGLPLELIDIQNIFCEVDKYLRLAEPQLNNLIKGAPTKRIKQLYKPTYQSLNQTLPSTYA